MSFFFLHGDASKEIRKISSMCAIAWRFFRVLIKAQGVLGQRSKPEMRTHLQRIVRANRISNKVRNTWPRNGYQITNFARTHGENHTAGQPIQFRSTAGWRAHWMCSPLCTWDVWRFWREKDTCEKESKDACENGSNMTAQLVASLLLEPGDASFSIFARNRDDLNQGARARLPRYRLYRSRIL